MAKTIEAKAVISAADKTGAVFDQVAKKMAGVEKVAKSFEGIKVPKFSGDLVEEMKRLNLSERELQGVRKSYAAFDDQLKGMKPGFAHYMRAHEEYKGKVVDNWREIKGSVDEAEKAHKRFFKTAGHFGRHAALHAIGGVGAGYLGAHAIGHLAKNAAERNREGIREEMAGFTPDQQTEANRIADEISQRHPSLSRTENLEDLRKNTARLGSFDRAKQIAEFYAKARIYNELSGGTPHELEKVSLAAEGAGAANTAEDYRDYMQGFLRARAVNSDYSGEDFAKDYRAATAAKYGWNKQYRENDFFTLASHTPGLGVKLATLNSAFVGSRMTKPSKAALQDAGLMDKKGHLIDEAGLQKNFYDWTQAHVKPFLEKKGVHFGENMSEDDKRTTAGWATKSISARNAADAVIAALIDAPLVEKGRRKKTMDLDKVDDLADRDGGLAFEGVKKQLGDFGTELTKTSAVVSVMNKVARDFAAYTSWIKNGEVPKSLTGIRAGLDWIEGKDHMSAGPNASDGWGTARAVYNGKRFHFPSRFQSGVHAKGFHRKPSPTIRAGSYADYDLRYRRRRWRRQIDHGQRQRDWRSNATDHHQVRGWAVVCQRGGEAQQRHQTGRIAGLEWPRVDWCIISGRGCTAAAAYGRRHRLLVMTDTEKIAALFRKVDDLTARQVALEAVIEHVFAPVQLAVVPQLASELVNAARGMEVKLPPDSAMRLLVEEHINEIADRLEQKVRSKAR